MIHNLRKLMQGLIRGQPGAEVDPHHRLQVATAALLLEMTRMDDDIHDAEREAVERAVRTSFDLSDTEYAELIRLAEEERRHAASYYGFTSLINDEFDMARRIAIVEQLWQVAYADRHLDMYEEHLVRKLAGLLHVSHKDFIAAKHRAMRGNGDR
jgi:uncharacterized tellurite resistance protein B-like protein